MEAAEGDPPADLDPALPVTAEPRAASGDDQDATEPPNKRSRYMRPLLRRESLGRLHDAVSGIVIPELHEGVDAGDDAAMEAQAAPEAQAALAEGDDLMAGLGY